jgi:hypothetical protein
MQLNIRIFDVLTARLGRAGFSHIYRHKIGIGIGILLHKVMNVGLILWLGIAQT